MGVVTMPRQTNAGYVIMFTFFRRLILLECLIMLSTGCSGAPEQETRTTMDPQVPSEASKPQGNYVPGELLVKFREQVSDADAAAAVEAGGGEMVRAVFDQQIFLIRYPSAWPIEQAIERFQSLAEIEWAEPNYIRRPHSRMPSGSTQP